VTSQITLQQHSFACGKQSRMQPTTRFKSKNKPEQRFFYRDMYAQERDEERLLKTVMCDVMR
jgi:hypothetical protein